jgi:hypothetical protein
MASIARAFSVQILDGSRDIVRALSRELGYAARTTSLGDSMANRRDTFAKRQRETDLKERARAKQARRLAKRQEVRTTKGPEMGELAVQAGSDETAPDVAAPEDPAAASDTDPGAPADLPE